MGTRKLRRKMKRVTGKRKVVNSAKGEIKCMGGT